LRNFVTFHVRVWSVANDSHRNTVTEINRNLSSNLRLCGPAVLFNKENEELVRKIATILLAIITKRHQCQQDLGDEEAEVDDALLQESSEYDWLVVDTAMEVLIGLSAALGESFGKLWTMFEKPVLKYASSQEATERSTAVGTIAECVGNMGKGCTPYTAGLLKIILHRLGDEDLDVKSNAVYAAGLLCEMSEDEKEILGSFNTILNKLEPMLEPGQNGRLLDNAAGCVSRMIKKYPTKVPLQLVLPALVEILPAREDYEENKPIFQCIVTLCKPLPISHSSLGAFANLLTDQHGEPTIQQLTPQLMPVFQKVLGEPEDQLDDETRAQVVELVKHLRS